MISRKINKVDHPIYKSIEEFKHKKMHIDCILEIQNIGDYSIKLEHLPKKQ